MLCCVVRSGEYLSGLTGEGLVGLLGYLGSESGYRKGSKHLISVVRRQGEGRMGWDGWEDAVDVSLGE